MTIRLILADDHRMFREALLGPLAAEPDIEVIGLTSTGAETLSALELETPDVLVLDIRMPDVNGIDVARHVVKRHPSVHIVALSGYADRLYVEEMLKAGACGYVVKSAGADELIAAIRAAATGARFLSSEAATVMDRHFSAGGTSTVPPLSVLTKREQEVLRLVVDGLSSAEIAVGIGIALSTAEVHRRNIKQKLGLNSTAELTRYAIREGLVAP
ncbi:MAG TPA: response regulator transcription factor [Telmatospirillum sp.]|nr:response regulator transcription factor [Telmatospirillum sp.]